MIALLILYTFLLIFDQYNFDKYYLNKDGTKIIKRSSRVEIHTLSIQQSFRSTQVYSFRPRKYLANNYDAIRQSPAKIIIRECENSQPTAIATFNYGIERTVDLRKLGAKEIDQAVAEL